MNSLKVILGTLQMHALESHVTIHNFPNYIFKHIEQDQTMHTSTALEDMTKTLLHYASQEPFVILYFSMCETETRTLSVPHIKNYRSILELWNYERLEYQTAMSDQIIGLACLIFHSHNGQPVDCEKTTRKI